MVQIDRVTGDEWWPQKAQQEGNKKGEECLFFEVLRAAQASRVTKCWFDDSSSWSRNVDPPVSKGMGCAVNA